MVNGKVMRKVLVLALLVILLLSACQQEIVASHESENEISKVYASLEDSSVTKTSLIDKDVVWSSGDQIAVFIKKYVEVNALI